MPHERGAPGRQRHELVDRPRPFRHTTFINPFGEEQTIAVGGRIHSDTDWLELFRAEGLEPPNLSSWKD